MIARSEAAQVLRGSAAGLEIDKIQAQVAATNQANNAFGAQIPDEELNRELVNRLGAPPRKADLSGRLMRTVDEWIESGRIQADYQKKHDSVGGINVSWAKKIAIMARTSVEATAQIGFSLTADLLEGDTDRANRRWHAAVSTLIANNSVMTTLVSLEDWYDSAKAYLTGLGEGRQISDAEFAAMKDAKQKANGFRPSVLHETGNNSADHEDPQTAQWGREAVPFVEFVGNLLLFFVTEGPSLFDELMVSFRPVEGMLTQEQAVALNARMRKVLDKGPQTSEMTANAFRSLRSDLLAEQGVGDANLVELIVKYAEDLGAKVGIKHTNFSRQVFEAIRRGQFKLVFKDLPAHELGYFDRSTRTIFVNPNQNSGSMLSTIVHEGSHGFDFAAGGALEHLPTDAVLELESSDRQVWLIRAREVAARRYQNYFAEANNLRGDHYVSGYNNLSALSEVESKYGMLSKPDFAKALRYLDQQFPQFARSR